jgi:GT2 family glycosyltransferase
MAETSIIIVTYNGLRDHTIPCLESIFHATGDEDYEVIVVDNNSSDGTADYLKELSGREPRLTPVLNRANRGFAGGNNDGIRVATGRIIVLLNNDTLVSDGWLSTVRSALLADHSIGLLGPVSNAVGNEQKIFTVGLTPEEILAEGRIWAEASAGDSFETTRLGFFCVALNREVIDRVGLLDEAYDLGFYEDDDYCLRVLKAGYRLVCREDVFIYHHGSASFSRTPVATKQLLKTNRRLLEAKFGISYHPRHPRDRLFELLEGYLGLLRSNATEGVRYKIGNRLRLLEQYKPHGMLKKLMFTIRAGKIRKLITELET